jgi:predicted LPLAT superfamily acyltransferase
VADGCRTSSAPLVPLSPSEQDRDVPPPYIKGVERRRGNRVGFWFFRTAIRLFGLTGAYGLLYFVAFYYLLFDRPVVAASREYIRRRFPDHGAIRQNFDVYLLFLRQGESLIDRYYVAAGGRDITIELAGYEKIKDILRDGQKGLILLTAHVGNWQVAMTALRKLDRTVYLMMRPEDNAAVKEALNIDSAEDKIRILYTDGSLGGVVEALKAISTGGIISIMGDRTYGYASVEASLLGGNVRFPYGVFSLATAAQCPVAVLLSAKTGKNKYIADVSRVIEPPAGIRGNKDAEIAACVQEFARILEEYADRYPYQWFVFRDMWQGNQ